MARIANKRIHLLFVWTMRSMVVGAIAFAWVILAREPDEAAVVPGQDVEGLTSILTRESAGEFVSIRLRDVSADTGIAFHHFPDARASLLPEDMGSGVACGDYDGDDWPDLFFVNFAGSIRKATKQTGRDGRSRLYRNKGDMRFEDVTDRAGIDWVGYGMGAAWGDYDNDGDPDLYITAFGENALFENRGNGTFSDATAKAGAGDDRFSAGCAWADYDRDGDLDLYVCNYVDFVFRNADVGVRSKQYDTEQPYTLNPSAYSPVSNSLFRNNGDGTFTDVADQAGVADPEGRSLASNWFDMNNDGWPDLYVANDVSRNGVFLNRGDGTFQDVGPDSLAADYRGAMGIAISDFDNDLDLDMVVTHWLAQENALYRNMILDPAFGDKESDRLWFLDSADAVGFGQVSLDMVGWATGFADFDNDGRRDLWIVNGSTFERADDPQHLIPQRGFLFWHRGPNDFIDIAENAAESLFEPFVGRGGVQADLDGDGRLDLVVVRHGDRPLVLQNVTGSSGHWLRIRLRQQGANTFAHGSRVFVTVGDSTQMAEIGSSGSYLSQDEDVVHFGLGDADRVERLRIVWPDGTEEIHTDLDADQTMEFVHNLTG